MQATPKLEGSRRWPQARLSSIFHLDRPQYPTPPPPARFLLLSMTTTMGAIGRVIRAPGLFLTAAHMSVLRATQVTTVQEPAATPPPAR